jgi:hypothetical protein
MVFIRVLRKIFRLKNNEVSNLEHYIMRKFLIYTGHLVLLGK